jgi:uncharacterized protein YbaR (Trm112 family)
MGVTQVHRQLDAIDGNLGGELASYIVCDKCGRIWDIPRSWRNPIGCPRCKAEALWRFDDRDHAMQHALVIRQNSPPPSRPG